MPPRSRRSSTNRPPRNSSRIPTAVRRREAPGYAELAQAAHAAGFEVTASQVHEWVVDGLLPRTAQQVSLGRHGFVTERAPGVTPQLLALCQLRRQTKSRHKLAVLLWAEGWPIDTERVRKAVLAWFPTDPLPAHPSDHQLDEWSRLAERMAPKLGAMLGLGRVGPEVADGLFQGMLLMAGQGADSLDEDGAAAIERAAGMAPRARRDRLDDAGPWLTGDALDGLVVMRAFTRDRLRSLVASATVDDLRAARPRVRFILVELPEFARMLELLGGRNFLGLGALPRLIRRAPEIALPLALFFAVEAPGLVTTLDELHQVLRKAPTRAALEAAEGHVALHPEQAAAIRRVGLLGLMDRGEIVVGAVTGADASSAPRGDARTRP